VTVGLVGAVSSTHWPAYIGLAKGYFAAEDVKPDLVFIQSSAALVQQLTGGSLDLALSTGLADPIRAIDKGSPVAIVRIEMQAPPYALLAKPAIKRWADLKGKTISIGGPKDITRIYLERMAAPNGLKTGEYDTVFAGATSARFSALQSGAVDAAILLPPFNFYAESAGFTNLGLTIDYAKELPFSGTVLGRRLGVGAQADPRQGALGQQQRAWPGSPIRQIAPKPSKSWWRQAGSRRRTSPGPTISFTRMNSSKLAAGFPGRSLARCSTRSKGSAISKARLISTVSSCRA
jgi:hypothetical protein